MSTARTAMLSAAAASTKYGADGPIAIHATPAMKNALHPSSTSARVVARHTETYDTIVRDASTTRICDEGENRGMFGTRSGHLYNVTVARG
jgi:hypothetical protein